ncbi:SANT/Myb-like DNA-binding domain-containing protein [Rahnella woolbedingensis]|uniref:SANT/Myb-like DNA-binding domain-containing protein n=1 Tax=Rahnella woolbedingensis TaxID=1510574 RepID=UPI001ABFC12C|nr:SANT/Myb-like DNA-binding domain-containing protein [Rahnella woolbedingensis]
MRKNDTHYRNHRSPWTLAELRYLEKHYGHLPTRAIATTLERTAVAVRLMAQKLGVVQPHTASWTEEEKNILRTHYARGDGIGAVGKLLPARNRQTIFTMAAKMGIRSARTWSRHEVKILKKYYALLGTKVANQLPGRTAEAVKIKANELRLQFGGKGRGKIWSAEEWLCLAQHQNVSATKLVELFPGRSVLSIRKAKARLKKRQRPG